MIPFGRMVKYGNVKPKPSGVIKISTSVNHVGILFDSGNLYLRGSGIEYKLGNNSTGLLQNGWVKCPQTNIVNVWCLSYATLVLTSTGEFWIAGQQGYVGIVATSAPGWTNVTSVFSSIPNLTTVKDISSTESSSFNGALLVLMGDGTLYGIGRNGGGALGVTGNQQVPFVIDSTVTVVAGTSLANALHYIKNGQYYRCGNNASRNLGTSSSSLSKFTVSTDILGTAIGIMCTTYSTTVLSLYGTYRAYTAGSNTEYCLGVGYGDTALTLSPFSATPLINGIVLDGESLLNSHSTNANVAMTQNKKLYTCGTGQGLGWSPPAAVDRSYYHIVQYEGLDTEPDVSAFAVQGSTGLTYALVGANDVYWCGNGAYMTEQSTPTLQVKMKKMILPE